jgi:peptidoglycan/xylan/chitin deacetylase (PgdA/CDA1 family)
MALIQQGAGISRRRTRSENERSNLGRRFACLTYHMIGEGRSQYNLNESKLHAQLSFLEGEGYVVDDFERLESRLRSNQGIPNDYVILTVDDGHESSMLAADVLQAHGCRATFFLTRDRCLRKLHFIRESQIRELRRRGFSVGTHGTTHGKLTFMAEEHCIAELSESKQWLEDVLGEEVRHMAAPGGYINTGILRIAYDSGYKLIGTCSERMNSVETMTLPGTVNRVNIRQHFALRDFCNALQGRVGFYILRQMRAAALALPKRLLHQ